MSEVDASAFDLKPAVETDAAALCVHGLTGTPYEVRPLAEALVQRGIRARGPVLPGHDSTPEELARTSFVQWVEAVEAEFRRLRSEHAQVFLVGLSLGGLLCLELASREPVDALAVVGTPLALRKPIPQLVGVFKRFLKMLDKSQGSDIRDPAARERQPGYKRMPLDSVHELVRLQRKVRPALQAIRAPTLVAHGRLDRTANPADAGRIYRSLGSREKELYYCEASGHVVTVDWDGEALAHRVADFMSAHIS
ncbi:MAG: alpha/beta fold hydrolase [Myxococcota bacterium]